jgi:hypothetical protein
MITRFLSHEFDGLDRPLLEGGGEAREGARRDGSSVGPRGNKGFPGTGNAAMTGKRVGYELGLARDRQRCPVWV